MGSTLDRTRDPSSGTNLVECLGWATLLERSPMDSQKTWLDPHEAAAYCGISVHTLERYRQHGIGPRYSLVAGTKLVRYFRGRLDEWLQEHEVTTAPRKAAR